jgi:hypothetical protein
MENPANKKQNNIKEEMIYPSFKSNWIYFDLYRLQPMRQPLRSKKNKQKKIDYYLRKNLDRISLSCNLMYIPVSNKCCKPTISPGRPILSEFQ